MSPRSQLIFLNVAHFACHYFLLIFPTAVIAIQRDWSLDYGAALALATPAYVCFALGTLPAGWLGDRWDGERLIALFFVGCGAAGVLIALAPGDLWLMAGLGLLGLFAAIYHPVGLAMVTRLSDRPGRALAMNGVFGNLGLAAASLVTALLTDRCGWRSAFLAPGIVAILIGAAQLFAQRRSVRAVKEVSDSATASDVAVPRANQLRVISVVLFAAVFSGFVFDGVSISLPKLFDERLSDLAGSLSGVGGYTALVFAVAAFAQLPVGALLDRIGGRPVWLALSMLEAGALAITSQLDGLLLIPSALATVTLMFAGLPLTGWLLGRYVALSWRSRVFAAEYVLSLGMSSVIVPVMAALHQAGYGFDRQYALFALSAAVVLLGAFALPKPAAAARAAVLRARV